MYMYPFTNFNSTVVQLEAELCSSMLETSLFQFYCSPIRSGREDDSRAALRLFQFYCSPIRRESERERKTTATSFQFYCSPIRRAIAPAVLAAIIYFNSTVVQLEGYEI